LPFLIIEIRISLSRLTLRHYAALSPPSPAVFLPALSRKGERSLWSDFRGIR
jgi:hypothetical protein